jgi:hypothetical protein
MKFKKFMDTLNKLRRDKISGLENKIIFEYNLDWEFSQGYFSSLFYKLKDIDKNKFIGSWKTESGSGLFTEFIEFTRIKEPIDHSRINKVEYENKAAYSGDFYKKLNIINVPIENKLDLSLLTILLCPTDPKCKNLLLILKREEPENESKCIICGKDYDFKIFYCLDEYFDEYIVHDESSNVNESYEDHENYKISNELGKYNWIQKKI